MSVKFKESTQWYKLFLRSNGPSNGCLPEEAEGTIGCKTPELVEPPQFCTYYSVLEVWTKLLAIYWHKTTYPIDERETQRWHWANIQASPHWSVESPLTTTQFMLSAKKRDRRIWKTCFFLSATTMWRLQMKTTRPLVFTVVTTLISKLL